jgi:hypothetical protein
VKDLILPRTDAGVAAQAMIAAALYVAGLVLVRRHRELRIFIIGLATITAAGFGLRALH